MIKVRPLIPCDIVVLKKINKLKKNFETPFYSWDGWRKWLNVPNLNRPRDSMWAMIFKPKRPSIWSSKKLLLRLNWA